MPASAPPAITGVHHHDAEPGAGLDETHTGLDHVSFGVGARADLDDIQPELIHLAAG